MKIVKSSDQLGIKADARFLEHWDRPCLLGKKNPSSAYLKKPSTRGVELHPQYDFTKTPATNTQKSLQQFPK